MKKEHMYPIVEQWLSSKGDISKVDFCREHNVSYHSLGYWQKKYTQEGKVLPSKDLTQRSDFLPVKVASSTTDPASTISPVKAEITFPSGLVLKIY